MRYDRLAERAFAMDERAWARHANPWSVWTRFTALPLLVLAAWSRDWIGAWALLPVLAALAWTYLNPRLFPPPPHTRSWASKAVLGERIWLARERVPIPERHRRLPHVLSAVAGAGALLVIWGVARLEPWPTGLGAVLVYAGKLWFLDRMVWLFEDMKDADPRYAAWTGRVAAPEDPPRNPP